MAGIADVVARAPGAVFAVDEQLRIVAWNRTAEQGLGLREEAVLGAPCYEVVQAVDADSGRPCYEHCPLVHGPAQGGWVHSRVLRAQWAGGKPVHLDCMLLQCVLPSSERGTLSFVTPLGAADAERYLRAMSAMETLYPVLTRSTDLPQSLGTVLRAVLQATSAEVAELVLLDPETQEPFQTICQAIEPHHEERFKEWLSTDDVVGLVAGSEGALVVFHRPDEALAPPSLPPRGKREKGEMGNGERGEEGEMPSAAGPQASRLRWCLTIPLFAEGRMLGALTVASHRPRFSLGFAARVLFAVGGQLSVFLRWALLRDQPEPRGVAAANGSSGPALRFYCFRRFRIVRDGQEIPATRFKRQKALSLLKVLVAHRGRPLHREALIEFLWPEADPTLANNNLRVVLHDLRRALEPDLKRGQPSSHVLSRGDLIYLDLSDRCWTDVEEFERLVKRFDLLLGQGMTVDALEAGRAAAALYASEYLEDEPYVDWCIAERERLREVCVSLLQRMAIAYAGCQQWEEAIVASRMALAADRLREETHRQLIGLLWKAGHHDEALRQYETCRRMLQEQLDVSPAEETEDLYRAILSQRKRPSGTRA